MRTDEWIQARFEISKTRSEVFTRQKQKQTTTTKWLPRTVVNSVQIMHGRPPNKESNNQLTKQNKTKKPKTSCLDRLHRRLTPADGSQIVHVQNMTQINPYVPDVREI